MYQDFPTKSVSARPMQIATQAIHEASIIAKVSESLVYVRQLGDLLDRLQIKLFGPFPENAACDKEPRTEIPLEELVRSLSQKTASLVGQASTIDSRL